MAYDASYDWPDPRRRWRRWLARLVALLALAACAAGVYAIVKDATKPAAPKPVSLQPEVNQVAESTEALARRLEALRARGDTTRDRALRAVAEAQGDRDSAAAAFAKRSANGTVRDGARLSAALHAHDTYLATVERLLRHPASKVLSTLAARAHRARAAWAALPDSAGLPKAIRGTKQLAAFARARRG